MLSGISLQSNFSGTFVSPSLVATSTLEMEDLPICIFFFSFCRLLSYFLSLFLTSVSASKSRGKLSMCIPGCGWSTGWWPVSRLVAPERTACFTLCPPCAAVCLFTDHFIRVVWSRDHLRWGQEGRWCLVKGLFWHFSVHGLAPANLTPKSQTLCGSQKLLGSVLEQYASIHQISGEPLSGRLVKCNAFCSSVSKGLFLQYFWAMKQ